MTLLRQYSSEAEAYIDKGMLQSNGIKCMVETNALSSIFPAPTSGSSPVSLYCEDDKAEEALRLLDEHGDR